MKTIMQIKKQVVISMLSCAALILTIGHSQAGAAGLLKPVNGDLASVEMKSHHVNVTINNGFAKTEVDQVFINSSDHDLEAIYSFPVPQNASLSEVSLWVDGNEIIGEVLEKEQAKKTYVEQKAKGNHAGLAEKNDFKTFDVKVYPVLAHDETRVRLVYYQPLEIDLNIGRYVYPLEEGNVDEERISFWETDASVKQSFAFNATLKSAFPIKDIRLPDFQNQAKITKRNLDDQKGHGDIFDVHLDFPEGGELTKDIVLYYRLNDNTPARVELIPYREENNKEGKFMLVVTPGADLQQISNGTDWTFVLDVSGSMDGNKLVTLVDGVRKSIKKMTPDHRFRIVTFSDRATDITKGYLSATPENAAMAAGLLNSVSAGGGTALFAGLEKAYDGLDSDRISGIILVTDGVANIGPSTHADLMDLHRRYDCRLFTFVIGNSANQPLLDSLAKESGGFAMNISSNDDLIGRILQAKAKMVHQSLHNVSIDFKGERTKDITPSDIGNIYIGRQIVLFGSYNSPGKVTIALNGKIDGNTKTWSTTAILPEVDIDNPEIERLWAMSHIEQMREEIRQHGQTQALKKDIIALATEYSLVTDYTSMVILTEQAQEALGIQKKNAARVKKERTAQQKRKAAPVQNYQVAKSNPSNQMFSNKSAPNVGTGAVGPLFFGLMALLGMVKSRKR